jgi:hypothetical protein
MSMNNAMINILIRKLNSLNLCRNFSHRKLSDCVEAAGVYQISYGRVANLMHLHSSSTEISELHNWNSEFRNSAWIPTLWDPQDREPSSNG